MRNTTKIMASLAVLSSAVQSAFAGTGIYLLPLADIAPDPRPGEQLPGVVAGVCLSLSAIFFGLWFTNRMKIKKADMALRNSADDKELAAQK